MSKPRVVCALLTISICFVRAAPQTQEESVLTRQSDESASSREERQQTLASLLAAARQVRDVDTAKAASFLNRAGRLQLRLNSSQDALSTYQSALAILTGSPDSTEKVDVLNGIAAAYSQLGKCDDAQDLIREVIASSEQKSYVAGKAEALLTLSDCQNYSDHALAAKTAQESLGLWQSIGGKAGVARTYAKLSDFQMAQSNLVEASECNEAALRIWRELNVPDEEAEALINLGFIEYRKGAWQNCLSFLTQAQSLIDEGAEPYKMGQISAGLAEAFIESGMPEIGVTKSELAREYYRRAEDPRGVAITTWVIGKAYYHQGNYAQALTSLNQALTEAEAMKYHLVVAFCHDYLGRTHNAVGDQSAALEHFQVALNSYSQLGNPMEVARTRALMGQIFQEQGQFEKANRYFQTALETFNKLGDRLNQSAALFALGRLELKRNNLDLAESYLRQSIDATENVRRVSTSGDLMASFSATVHDRYETYIECLMRKHNANPTKRLDVRAFETSEFARGRSLAELLRSTQTNFAPGLDPQLAEQEKSLRQALRTKEDYRVSLLGTAYKKEELNALETDLSRLESEYQQVNATIRAQYPAYDHVTKPVALTLAQIQKDVVVDDETLLLEYSLGTERSYLWAISRTDVSSYELPGRAEIKSQTQHFYDLLTAIQPKPGLTFEQQQERVRQADAQLPAVTASFSKLLLGPVADKLGSKRLLIVADGPLQYIPFQSLVFPGNTNLSDSNRNGDATEQRLLIRDHEIINEPSASILAIVLSESANRRLPSHDVAVLADPVFESDDPRIASPARSGSGSTTGSGKEMEIHQALRDVNVSGNGHIPRLLASRAEANAIMAVTPWRSGFEAVDFQASRATVTRTDLSDYRIVHFATHGLLNNEHPELSGVVLSLFDEKGQPQDGFLRLHDIYNLKLPADLVVLSACNTGLGKDVKGEGLIGLTRGFMYAGASSVVASLWKVDDEATAELMRYFYSFMLKDGLSPAAALRKAQVTMSQQKRWQSPYYWSGFIIQGQYIQREPMNHWRPTQVALLGGVAALLVLAAFFLMKRRRRTLL